jgi:hypothetical protein
MKGALNTINHIPWQPSFIFIAECLCIAFNIIINMKQDSKIFWKFIQSKTKTKENIPCIIDEKGEINTNDRTF